MSQQLFPAGQGAPDPMSRPRQAALLLHALCAEDRQWLLAQLPPGQRATLGSMLSELDALGIPADPELLGQLEARGKAATAGTQAATRPEPDDFALADMAAQRLARVLAHEPSELGVRLLSIRPWPWTAELLRLLPEGKSHEISARLREAESALPTHESARSQLDAVLLQKLRQRLDTLDRSNNDGAQNRPPRRPAVSVFERVAAWRPQIAKLRGMRQRSARPLP